MFYNNRLNDKTMIISTNAEKAFVKIKYLFFLEKLSEVGIEDSVIK